MRFKKNDVIKVNDTDQIEIVNLLGEGGQGEVYLVNYKGGQYAFKSYIDEVSSDFRFNLKNNIEKGSPSNDFLWPKLLVDLDDTHCGYLMDLRPSNYASFVSYLTGATNFKDTKTMLKWCIELCISFKKLHEKGYSYQDLNDGSFFLDPNTGDLLICDNDNVGAYNHGVLGKMKYMAPEIVRGDKSKNGTIQMPDVHSDRFSLAIILFLALCLGNPYEGECLKNYDIIDADAEYEIYGTHPVFIYHKSDKSNRPIRGYHTSVIKRWPKIPLYIKEAFHRTFVDGLNNRENERTTEIEWIKLLTKYRDELIQCSCGEQYVYGFSEKKLNSICPYCGTKTRKLCELVINRNRIILQPGKMIYANHVDKYSAEYNSPVGIVVQNKRNPSLWGIKFSLPNDIQVKDGDGNVRTIPGDGVVPIVNNLKVRFQESSIGEIRLLE